MKLARLEEGSQVPVSKSSLGDSNVRPGLRTIALESVIRLALILVLFCISE